MAFDDSIKAGATSKIIEVMLRNSSTGAGETGLAHTDVTASYTREGGTRTAITLASGTAGDAYSSGKWAEVDATNCKGLYQLHIPDAAIAASVEAVTISLQATGVIDKSIRIKLRATDVQDAAAGGMTKFADIETDTGMTIPGLIATAQEDLDKITGVDGATLATAQGNYAPAKAGDKMDIVDAPNATAVTAIQAGLSTYDGSDTSGTTTLLTRVTETRMAELDPANLPADIDAVRGVIVDKLDDTLEDNAGTFRFTAAALAQAPTGSGGDATEAKQDQIISLIGTPTDTDIATDLANVQTAVDGINVGTGDGARTVTVTVDDGTDTLQNAIVRMTEGANAYRATTDVNGQCTFNLDDATYTVAITKAGYSFAGTSLVVDGVETPTYSMTQTVITAPPSADTSTGVIECRDEQGLAEEGVQVSVVIRSGPGDDGFAYDSTPWTETSDSDGLVQFAGLIRGAEYQVYRSSTPTVIPVDNRVVFTVPDQDSFNIAEVIGKP